MSLAIRNMYMNAMCACGCSSCLLIESSARFNLNLRGTTVRRIPSRKGRLAIFGEPESRQNGLLLHPHGDDLAFLHMDSMAVAGSGTSAGILDHPAVPLASGWSQPWGTNSRRMGSRSERCCLKPSPNGYGRILFDDEVISWNTLRCGPFGCDTRWSSTF